MEYISVGEAAQRWDISPRQVQTLCAKGRIDGAQCFSRVWMIPKDAQKPSDGRIKHAQADTKNSQALAYFQANKLAILEMITSSLPNPLHVYAQDGTLVMTNPAFIRLFNIAREDKIVGKYNVLEDPLMEKWGLREAVLRTFNGEVAQLFDIKVPIPEIIHQYGERALPFTSLLQNITAIPVCTQAGRPRYVVVIFVTSRLYVGKQEIIAAKEYLETHWLEDFDIEKLSAAAYLSRYHLARLFKKHTGITPYGYYQQIKLKKLKEALKDQSFSIRDAFLSCGMEYNGAASKMFKAKCGMTPSQYRKTSI
jgi:AraC-like DNA-binding protein